MVKQRADEKLFMLILLTNTHVHVQLIYKHTHKHTNGIKDCSQSANEAEHLLSSDTLWGDICQSVCAVYVCVLTRNYVLHGGRSWLIDINVCERKKYMYVVWERRMYL